MVSACRHRHQVGVTHVHRVETEQAEVEGVLANLAASADRKRRAAGAGEGERGVIARRDQAIVETATACEADADGPARFIENANLGRSVPRLVGGRVSQCHDS